MRSGPRTVLPAMGHAAPWAVRSHLAWYLHGLQSRLKRGTRYRALGGGGLRTVVIVAVRATRDECGLTEEDSGTRHRTPSEVRSQLEGNRRPEKSREVLNGKIDS